MAIYYVSVQRGNDGNNGLSQAVPFATITKAVAEVAAEDIVYIGPGTYREKPSFATAGSAGKPITWIPDPMCKYLTNDNPGIVRVTGCGADELPTAGVVWFYNAKDYNIIGDATKGFGQIYIDGSSDIFAVSAAVTANRFAIGVTAHGKYGFNYGTNTNCIAAISGVGFEYGANTNCIAVGGYYGFRYGTNTNCIAVGGYYGFYYGINTNCIAVGGYYGFDRGLTTNCIAVGGYYGFSGSIEVYSHCRAVACYYGFYGTSTTNKMDVSTCSVGGVCVYNQRGGGYETGAPALAKATLYDLQLLATAFQPLLALDTGDGVEGNLSCISVAAGDTVTINGLVFKAHANTTDVSKREFRMNQVDILDAVELVTCINDATYGVPGVVASSVTRDIHLQAAEPAAFTLTSSNATRLGVRVAPKNGYDIMGHERLLGDGTIDIGPYALSNVATEWTTYKTQLPAIKITRAGQQRFTFWAKGGVEFSRSVWVKWSDYAGANKPQIIADGDNLTRATTTATGDGTAFEQISVSATPGADGEVVIYLYARDVAAAALTYFSDIE